MSDRNKNEKYYRTWKRITFWLILLFTSFWGIWSIFATVPSTTLSLAYGDYHFFGLKLSRWLDFLAIPVWTSMYVLACAVIEYFDDDDSDMGWRGILATVIYGLVCTITLFFSLILIGLLPGLFVCLVLIVVGTVIYFCTMVVMDFILDFGKNPE